MQAAPFFLQVPKTLVNISTVKVVLFLLPANTGKHILRHYTEQCIFCYVHHRGATGDDRECNLDLCQIFTALMVLNLWPMSLV